MSAHTQLTELVHVLTLATRKAAGKLSACALEQLPHGGGETHAGTMTPGEPGLAAHLLRRRS